MFKPQRQTVSFSVKGTTGWRPQSLTAVRRLVTATKSRPWRVGGTAAIFIGFGVLFGFWARPEELGLCYLLLPLGIAAYVIALTSRHPLAVSMAVVAVAIACFLADLPVDRPAGGLMAAIYGIGVLVLIELASTSIESAPQSETMYGPGSKRIAWVLLLGVAGAGAGLALLSLRSNLSGFGLVALCAGTAAAVLVTGLIVVLARSAIAESDLP